MTDKPKGPSEPPIDEGPSGTYPTAKVPKLPPECVERIDELFRVLFREKYDSNQSKMSRAWNVAQPTISDYTKGLKDPSIPFVWKLADDLGLSTDDVIGRPWPPNRAVNESGPVEALSPAIAQLLARKHIEGQVAPKDVEVSDLIRRRNERAARAVLGPRKKRNP